MPFQTLAKQTKPSFAPKERPHIPHHRNIAMDQSANHSSHNRSHPLLRLQQSVGNQAVQRLIQSSANQNNTFLNHGNIQFKLRINRPGDIYEQEAERVAQEVMTKTSRPDTVSLTKTNEKVNRQNRRREDKDKEDKMYGKATFTPVRRTVHDSIMQRSCSCHGSSSGLTGECEECRKKRKVLQPYSTNRNELSGKESQIEVPFIVNEVLNSPGQSLDTQTRTFMESRFGYDFGGVRVHSDGVSGESAKAVDALAYTVGPDVVFGAGQYSPRSQEGQRLLAHELTHVIQQAERTDLRRLLQRDFWDDEDDEGVLDWVSEKVEGAAEWASETGSDVAEWASETGSDVAEWASETGSDVAEWASETGSDVAEWASETGSDVAANIPYPKEGEIVCNEDRKCWQTHCEGEHGENCEWYPYDPGEPTAEGEPKEGTTVCGEGGCVQNRCSLSVDGKWTCEWWAAEREQTEEEKSAKKEQEVTDCKANCWKKYGAAAGAGSEACGVLGRFGWIGQGANYICKIIVGGETGERASRCDSECSKK